MKISRRKFVEAAPIVAGAVLGLQNVALGQKIGPKPSLPPVGTDTLSRLSWNSFLPYEGTEFIFQSGEREVPLRLESMVDTRPSNLEHIEKNNGECFMLRFVGPGKMPLRQGTFDVSHFILGDFRLFITEGGQVKRNNYYTAVINRIVS